MAPEKSVEGSRAPFPETMWSTILADPDAPASRDRLGELFRRYWKPVYGFIRASRRKSRADAEDLTQAFFQELLERGVVAKYQRERGRFRDFLKASLHNFISHDYRDSVRQKRGGGAPVLSLDVGECENAQFLADLRQRTPDELFDLEWARELLRQAIVRLRESLAAAGKEVYFRVYEAYDMAPPDRRPPTYADIAAELGLKPHDVENYLNGARGQLRKIMTDFITDYASSREDVVAELRDLFSK